MSCQRTCGPMDKVPAYGAGDSRFDPWHVQLLDRKFGHSASISILREEAQVDFLRKEYRGSLENRHIQQV
jgi:hypothetical protein